MNNPDFGSGSGTSARARVYTISAAPTLDPNSRYISHSVDGEWNVVNYTYDGSGDGNNMSTVPQFDLGPLIDYAGNEITDMGEYPFWAVSVEFDEPNTSARTKVAAFLSDSANIGGGFDFGMGFEIKSASTGLSASSGVLYTGNALLAASTARSYLDRMRANSAYSAGFLFGVTGVCTDRDQASMFEEVARNSTSVGGIGNATNMRVAIGQSSGGASATNTVRFRISALIIPFLDTALGI